jgi:hypothetical protein
MVQPPNEYHMTCHFLLALNIDIQSAVIRFGFNLENHDLETIYEAARQVEASQTYERWDEIQRQRRKTKEPKEKGSKKTDYHSSKHGSSSALKPQSSFKQVGASGSKGGGSSSKLIECFNCKQLGHYSSDCPKRSARWKTAARAEVIPAGAEEELVNAIEGFDVETASEADYASAEEQSQDDGEHLDGDIPDDNDDNVSLNDWCGHV